MTEAGWTRKRPTKEGVYWFRWGKDRDAIIVLVLIEYGDWRVMEMGHQHSGALAGYVTGEFLGPITPDSYQQGWVAGLQFAAKQAGIGAQLWEAGMKDREAAALLEFQGWLLKQAQDEKGVGDVATNVHTEDL